MFEKLEIIVYPDPRLRKVSKPVTAFDSRLKALVARMFELMREQKGVGLAAPQVGENIRLFVMNPTGEPGDEKVYVNPQLIDVEGDEEDEEGCLSLPNIRVNVLRGTKIKIKAQDVDGQPFEETSEGFITRVWQHETDHLNGTLILDRMGPVAKLANRKKLKELEAEFAERQKKR